MSWNRVIAAIGGLWFVAVAVVLSVPSALPVAAATVVTLCVSGLVISLRASRIEGTGRRARLAWRLIASAFPMHLLVLVLFSVGSTTFPAPADAVRMAIVTALLVAAFMFPLSSTTPLERRKVVLDVLIVGVAAALSVWFFVAGPSMRGEHAIVAAAAVYPVLDLLLIFGFLRLAMRGTPAAGGLPVLLLAGGIGMQFVADAWTGYLTASGGGTDREVVSQIVCTVTMLALLNAAAASRCAEGDRPLELSERFRVRRLPYLGIALCYGLMAFAAWGERNTFPWTGLTLGSIAITGLVVLRQLAVQRESDHAAATDGLTGLANRSRLRELIVQELERAARSGRTTAVLIMDMNGFKQINDTRGHKAGDQMLVGFARIVRDAILGSDVAGRLGGDEFAVLLHDIGGETNAEAVARRITAGTTEPIVIDGTPVAASASIGIALSGPGEFTADELLHRADVAMYHAKRRGGDTRWACFADTMGDGDEPSLEDELRAAIPGGQLRLVFQPIVSLPDEELCGIEALCRWEHPRLGLLDAEAFIPLAEQAGVIGDLGRWVLREACTYARRWPQLPLHVNVSGRQLNEDGFSAEVRAIVRATGLKPEQLVLEVTENQLIADEVPRAHLEILNDEGIRIALDDFGTGYSSLFNLTRLPIDMLKLDREFVATLDASAEGAAVAQAVLRLGRVLGMDTIAEGVETAAQARELTLLGASKAQGHYFARPLPADKIDERIAAWSNNRYGKTLRA